MKLVNLFKILLILFYGCSEIIGDKCKPDYYKSKNIEYITKIVIDFQTTKWNDLTPSHDDLADEVQFLCMETYE